MEIVSTHVQVFSEAWSIVRDLQARVAPAVTNETNIGKSFSASKPSCSTSQGQQEAHHGGAAAAATGGGAKEERVVRDEPLAATLLVAPRVHPFNAALFENLSLNLAIALKQTPIMDHIEVEVRIYCCAMFVSDEDGPVSALVPVAG